MYRCSPNNGLSSTYNCKRMLILPNTLQSSKKPTNKLEEEIYEALEAEAHVIERPDHFLTETEEKSLAELNAEEVMLKTVYLVNEYMSCNLCPH